MEAADQRYDAKVLRIRGNPENRARANHRHNADYHDVHCKGGSL
jgi:hypothetical protein